MHVFKSEHGLLTCAIFVLNKLTQVAARISNKILRYIFATLKSASSELYIISGARTSVDDDVQYSIAIYEGRKQFLYHFPW